MEEKDMEKTDLQGLRFDESEKFAVAHGEPAFRGRQLFRWINKGARDFSQMSDLSLGFREKLEKCALAGSVHILDMQEDEEDGTRKFLFDLSDGSAVEGVFMKYRYGNSLCISSQVGCRMGCAFCASALGGFERNLTAGEMMGQIFEAERAAGEKVNHIVVMGMGEPFDNYENLSRFLDIVRHKDGKNLSSRNITVSTSGIIPFMERFCGEFPQVNLAVSLHRLDDEGRDRIMPVNRAYPVDELIETARKCAEKTGRRITFEYALIEGENDTANDIELMKRKLSGILCHVNLIPLNPVAETGFKGSSRKRAEEVAAELVSSGIPATVRREVGRNIDGACGQLRLRRRQRDYVG